MASLRAYLQAALTGLGFLVAAFGASLAATIETPPGGGDIPTGFAIIFSWGLIVIGAAIFSLGAVILDDSGLGAYFSHHQRLAIRIGGGLLLLAAIAPIAFLVLLGAFYGLFGPSGPGQTDTLLSTLLLIWLVITALGGTGIVGGVLWRVGEATIEYVENQQAN